VLPLRGVAWFALSTLVTVVAIACGTAASQARIVYVTCSSASECAFVSIDPDGSDRRTLFTLDGERDDLPPLLPQCSPDGKEIVYFLSAEERTSIFKATLDGSEIVELTPTLHAVDPAWSPDGTKIVFSASTAEEPSRPQLWVMNSDGADAHPITADRSFNLVPAWSPDGHRIAFTSTSAADQASLDYADLWVVNAGGSDARPLISGPSHDRQPAWSPDGRTLAFTRVEGSPSVGGAPGSGGAIFLASASGLDVRALTSSPPRAFLPRWSPDGEQVVFSVAPTFDQPLGQRDPGFQIYVIGAHDTGQTQITDEPNGAHFATWCHTP